MLTSDEEVGNLFPIDGPFGIEGPKGMFGKL